MAEHYTQGLRNIRKSDEVREPLCATALVAAADAIIGYTGLERDFTVKDVVELFPEGSAELVEAASDDYDYCVVTCERDCLVKRTVWPINRLVSDGGKTLRDAGLAGSTGTTAGCRTSGELTDGPSVDLYGLANSYISAAYAETSQPLTGAHDE